MKSNLNDEKIMRFSRLDFHPWKDVEYSYLALNLTQTRNFRHFQTKGFADDNFEFDINSRKFSKQVENNVGKKEIAHDKQFLLFPQCFQKACTADVQKQGLV